MDRLWCMGNDASLLVRQHAKCLLRLRLQMTSYVYLCLPAVSIKHVTPGHTSASTKSSSVTTTATTTKSPSISSTTATETTAATSAWRACVKNNMTTETFSLYRFYTNVNWCQLSLGSSAQPVNINRCIKLYTSRKHHMYFILWHTHTQTQAISRY